MVNLRDLAALVLLVQLMTVSRGTDIKDIGVIEEILPKNVSILMIDGKTDDHSDTTIRNVTTLNIDPNISNDNSSMILNALIKKEEMLEAELEEAIEGAAASGQVILISPPADKINSTKELPVIVIETIDAESLKSVINDTSSDKMFEETIPSFDQEIAQSRIHKRSVSANYDNNENSENLEDLLAVTDYEPQKIDAKNIEEKSSQTSSDVNSQKKTTSSPVEEIHYDVPKRRKNPKKLQIILSDAHRPTTPKSDLKVSSTDQVPLATLSSELDPIEIEQKKIEAERKLFSSPSTFYHKPIVVYTETLRDRRHPKIDSVTTRSSLPIRVAYGSVPPRINPFTVSSAIDVSPTLVPDSSRNNGVRLRNKYNFINVAEPLKNNVRSRVGVIPPLIHPNHRSASENETIFFGDKLIDSGGAQANRRIDYYRTPEYLASLKPKTQSLTNEQLGYLTRYNQPSLLAGKSRSHPVGATHRQIGSPNESWKRIPGTPDPSRSTIITHPRDSYDLQGRKITSRPPTVDYNKDGRTTNLKTTPIYNSDSEESEEETKPNSHRLENGDYQRNRNRPQSSAPSAYDSYEETDKETAPNNQREENAAYQRNKNQASASTTPADESYEEDEEETVPKDRREENSAHQDNRNRQQVSTTPFNNFYEDYKQSANVKIANDSPTVSYENYKDSAENLKTVKNSPESSDEEYKESESSTSDRNSPTTLYNDYKNSAENVEAVRNSPESSYEESKESESSNADRNLPTWTYDDYKNAKIGEDSSTASYKESESSNTDRILPTWSYDDYKNAKIGDYSSTASYEDYKDSAENSKIVGNSPSASNEDSKETDRNSKIVRNSPVSSYEDYEESDNSKIVRNSKESIASTTPVDDSYEDYKESQSAKSLKNSPDVPSTAAYNSYESSEQSDHQKLVPQLQRLIPNSVEQRKRLPINSHPVPTHPPNNYAARTIQPITPISLLNNPIYQLHGLRTTAIPVKGVYNPYANYLTRKPSRLVSYDRQNSQSPRATVTSQRIVSTTPAYDSYEYTAQTNNPSIAIPRITNPKYPDHRIAKTSYSNIDQNIENASIAPVKKNADYAYRQRVGIPYAVIPSNTISPLPPQGILQPQRNLHRTISKVSPPAHVESIDNGNEYDESIVRIPYATETRKLRPPKASQYREANNPVTSSRSTPEYDSYESDDREISPSPASRSQLNEPHSPDYGNRIKTKVPEKQRDRVVAPLYSKASATTPTRQSNVLNYENGRPVRTHEDGAPVELVNRPNARISSGYQDEVPAGSGHEEKHEKHETHEAEKKEHDGGDHKHEEGGGEKHEEGHHGSHGEKGDKGYKSWHEHDKAEKGHHDKESHEKEYEEKKGDKKKHEEESDYHKEHHHEEKGNKEAEFAEKGEHQKGHSTKGQHVVHKKDEFEKKTEFYDESHEESSEEKEGEHHGHHESEKGGHEKFAHLDSAHHEEKHGKKGEHEKGHHYDEDKGHKKSDGHEKHHHHEEKYGKKGGHEEGKKWSHQKGDNGKKDS